MCEFVFYSGDQVILGTFELPSNDDMVRQVEAYYPGVRPPMFLIIPGERCGEYCSIVAYDPYSDRSIKFCWVLIADCECQNG